MSGLSFALVLLTFVSWLATLLLVRAAFSPPRIGALVERALNAVVLSAFGTICMVIIVNTDTGAAMFPLETARMAFRVALFGPLLVPVYWLWLYLSGRLGEQ